MATKNEVYSALKTMPLKDVLTVLSELDCVMPEDNGLISSGVLNRKMAALRGAAEDVLEYLTKLEHRKMRLAALDAQGGAQ
jgi:hypothetical protein